MVAAPVTRRRFLHIAGAAGLALALPLPALAQGDGMYRWRGIVLGADASMQIYLPQPGRARALVQACLAEITRLERIFSLYDPHSALSQLNRQGHLDAPPPELVELLARAQHFSELSEGAFDVTVQPLWRLYADNAAAEDIARALPLVDYRRLHVLQKRIAFAGSGMQATLNGIAQGFITDMVVALLKSEGITHTLVDMGESRAIGAHPDGRKWRLGIRDPGNNDALGDALAATLQLDNNALATSGGYGTRFESGAHHLLNPKTGQSAGHYASVSVLAPDATTADALSTALYILPPEKSHALAKSMPGVSALFILPDGSQHRIS